MRNLYIVGTGGHALEAFESIIGTESSKHKIVGNLSIKDGSFYLTSDNGITPFIYPEEASFVIAVGNKFWRSEFIKLLSARYPLTKEVFPNFISSLAFVSKSANLGLGNVIFPFATVSAHTVLGNFNLVHSYCGIFSETEIGNYNIFSPYSATMSRTMVGNNNYLGVSSKITKGISIGDNNTISSGEIVFDDLDDSIFFQSGVEWEKQ